MAADAAIPRLRQCVHVNQERAPQAEALITLVKKLSACSDNPLGDVVSESLDFRNDPAILLTTATPPRASPRLSQTLAL